MSKDNRKYVELREEFCAQFFLFSRIFYKAIQLSELYRLPRCIDPYKLTLCDAFINVKKINVTFYKPPLDTIKRNLKE